MLVLSCGRAWGWALALRYVCFRQRFPNPSHRSQFCCSGQRFIQSASKWPLLERRSLGRQGSPIKISSLGRSLCSSSRCRGLRELGRSSTRSIESREFFLCVRGISRLSLTRFARKNSCRRVKNLNSSALAVTKFLGKGYKLSTNFKETVTLLV